MFFTKKREKKKKNVYPTHRVFEEKRTKHKVMPIDIVMPEEY